MSKAAQNKLGLSKFILNPNYYIQAMYQQYAPWVLDEEDCLHLKNKWRKQIFHSSESKKLNLEIGPGAGQFFNYLSLNNPQLLFIAIELKYKPLIQTAHKLQQINSLNTKVIRYNARILNNIFATKEVDDIYIYFPDPWPKTKHHKHRLISAEFVKNIHQIQKDNSFVEIKTDHKNYFQQIITVFKDSMYKKSEYCEDLHKNLQLSKSNFTTSFEKIFIKKNLPIYYAKYIKKNTAK